MALINCEKCGKEISDKAKHCIHCGELLKEYKICPECNNKIPNDVEECSFCGFPFEEIQKNEVVKDEFHENESDDKFFYKLLVGIFAVAAVVIAVMVINMMAPKAKYDEAVSLLEDGEYWEAIGMLDDIESSDAENLYEQAYYEMCILSAYNSIKEHLVKPDIGEIYDVELYDFSSSDHLITTTGPEGIGGTYIGMEENKPYIIIHFAWINNVGGTVSQYAGCIYDREEQKYVVRAYACDIDIDRIEKNCNDYDCIFSAIEMNDIKEGAKECGKFNLKRINKAIESGEADDVVYPPRDKKVD